MDETFAAFPSWLVSTAADRATKAPAQRHTVQAVQPGPSPHRSPPARRRRLASWRRSTLPWLTKWKTNRPLGLRNNIRSSVSSFEAPKEDTSDGVRRALQGPLFMVTGARVGNRTEAEQVSRFTLKDFKMAGAQDAGKLAKEILEVIKSLGRSAPIT
jgi:hypothetical protein